MKTAADVDDAIRLARHERASLLLAQARGQGRAVLLARAIYALPTILLLAWSVAFSAPDLLPVAIAMGFGFTGLEIIVDRRVEALLTLFELKAGGPTGEVSLPGRAASSKTDLL
jgi:hypothetical protein